MNYKPLTAPQLKTVHKVVHLHAMKQFQKVN